MEIDIEHLKFKHPCTVKVSGPSYSGKTFLLRNILKNFKILFHFNEDVDELHVLWAYGVWQDLYDSPITHDVSVQYIDYLPSQQELRDSKIHVLVLDDMM